MTLARKGLICAVGLTLLAFLSGCTYESDPKQLMAKAELPAAAEGKPAPAGAASAALKEALAKVEKDPATQSFWFKGFVKNTILSRETTSMFEGGVNRPDSYTVTARIAAQPFTYYRYKDKRFINAKNAWMTATEEPLPVDVFKGFDDWLPFMEHAVQLPNEKVVGKECIPYQVKISAQEWLSMSNHPQFEPLRKELANRPDMADIIKKSTVKMTMWFGKDDQLIHQYETWLIIPLPGAGYMDQRVFFQLFKYSDQQIEMKDPAEVEKYLLY